ncbi:similar to Saccharomyces cerevisiae YGR178C PBP1 Component of glucose deprivation induced stress granules, involved in P-body-dependent granule assembly [Maudiozyma barnettii]|uniref:Similar to Saccharomyces cerevisiae YGR178C PBP1 Component of glucose deprivation induced stress granules, involved in P-body-dependent granule assembly n=1 Tax=Maudiozyma barnettii TaxID=61262 RepID=A0A8H2ZHH0_9SACH|nr:Pbp1p [Kazachstania barnettii]CAB4255759.1 similar to Saccharomyces cerevisiae YGR178C PBP1 Component of glucose deprivation induced stress granules, involved in P-body-dependent granule assembly [Kazachstania barnettii]CAD1784320.1 similar to Saccharomyces cerevisiae YGR178C PBP1 Component of glucose deprivation induced stress granules, involved in P-body-dependent granule assembly [Kazachstania barnettii]
MKPGNNKKKDTSPSAVSTQKKGLVNTKGSNGDQHSLFDESSEVAKQFRDRFDYLLTESIGNKAIVTTASGSKYSGILAACNLESIDGLDIVLKKPTLVSSLGSDIKAKKDLGETLLLKSDNVAELELKNINLGLDGKTGITTPVATPKTEKIAKGANQFRTDVDISNVRATKERELQRWTPDEGDFMATEKSQTLEEASSTWDQFSVNEKKFGIKSTYDEHFYTTRINRNDPNYQQKLKEAQKLADEIEKQGTSGNIHIAEDRGIIVDDSGMDEEDLYSGVDRRGDELLASLKSNAKPSTTVKSNKYVPPTLRNQPHHMDPAIISSSAIKVTGGNIISENKSSTKTTTTESVKKNTISNDTKDTTKPTKENVRPKAHLKNVDEEIKKQLKEIKRQSGRSDHSSKTKALPANKTSKEAQIEELKNFAQKFKVPYDVPKDMNDVLRKPSVSLKADPSLPPKPKSNSTTPGVANKNSTKVSNAANGAASLNKTDSKKSGSSSNNGPVRTSTHGRRRPAGSFFGSKKPQNNGANKDTFGKNFNFFLKSKEAHNEEKSMEPFLIEKPYFATPTWINTIEESHKSLFDDENTIMQESQAKLQMRHMNAMNGMGNVSPNMAGNGMNMMSYPMMNGPNGAGSPNPMMNGYNASGMGMYMPFQPQPMFYPSMGPMVPVMGGKDNNGNNNGASPPPQDMTAHMGPGGYMNVGAPYGYPVGGMAPFPGMMGHNGMMGGATNDHRHKGHYNHKNNNHRS